MISRARKLIDSSRFARNTATMSLAGIASHGLFLAASPVLTRLFTPTDFALLVLFTTAQALLLTFVTGRIEWSVPNARNPREALAMIAACFAILGLSCSALLVCAAFLPMMLLDYVTDLDISRKILFFLVISVMFSGTSTVLQSWFVANGTLSTVSQSRVAMALCYVAAAVVAGIFAASGFTLIISFVISHLVATLVLIGGCRPMGLVSTTWADIRSVLQRFRSEILASLGSSIVHGLSFYLMFLLIWWRFDAVILGWFALVFRIAMAPIGLLTASLAKGFWAEAADLAKQEPERLRRLYLRVSLALCGPALACAALTLTAPYYFGTIFGADWAGAGRLLAGLTPMLLSLIICSSTNHFIVYHRQHWQLYCDMTTIALMLLAFYVGGLLSAGPALTVWMTSSAFMISYLIRFVLLLHANTLQTANLRVEGASA